MLGDVATIGTVCDALEDFAPDVPVVLDPVMVAKGGQALLATDAVDSLRRRLLPLSAVITPNLPEAEALTGLTIRTEADMRTAAASILRDGRARSAAEGRPPRVRHGNRPAGDGSRHARRSPPPASRRSTPTAPGAPPPRLSPQGWHKGSACATR